jgi:transcriptional regulator with XRE-family HTH domain
MIPARARARFRRRREAAGLSQIGLSRKIGRSNAYIPQLEAGRLNPSPSVREAIAELLGGSVDVIFAGFPTPKATRKAALRKQITTLYDQGKTDAQIGELLSIPPGSVTSHRRAVGHKGRPNLATFDRGGKITSTVFARKHGFNPYTLRAAIDAGRLSGERVPSPAGSHTHMYLVDEQELLAEIARLPVCRYELCEQPALAESGFCSGPHARAVECRGEWWGTDEGAEFLEHASAIRSGRRCWICKRVPQREEPPALVARAWRAKRRRVCEECRADWLGGLSRVRSALVLAGADRAAGNSERNQAAVRGALVKAHEAEEKLLAKWPRKPGHKLEIAPVLVLEELHRLRFPDLLVDQLLGMAPRYTKTRRQRHGISRRKPSRVAA